MAKKSILPDVLRKEAHVRVLDEVAAERFESMDLSVILVYLIDSCPVECLLPLAVQFNVLGYKGWRFATTDTLKRELLKKAIEIQRFKGTPWSIEEALRTIGVTGAITIQEGIYHLYDGQYIYDGSITYGGNGWAVFRVIIDVVNLSTFDFSDLVKLILEYKNVRSWLEDLTIGNVLTESAPGTESIELGMEVTAETLGPGCRYDGSRTYNGAVNYDSGEYETFVVNINP